MSSHSLIREAEKSDLDRIVEMGSKSLETGPYAGLIADKPEQARKCAEWVMQNGKILLAMESGKAVGLVGFLVTPQFFSGEPHGAELMWWVDEDYRHSLIAVCLLRAAERKSREMGAKSMIFTAPTEEVGRMYSMLGYDKLETNYRKVL